MRAQVRFQLHRRGGAEPAAALFLETQDPAALLAICTRLGLDPTGRVHHLSGGFLLELPRPSTEPWPGAIRLRRLARDVYLPVDAELVPALLDDEAAGLVRGGGLVFLPGDRILRFDRRVGVAWAGLLVAARHPPRVWTSFAQAARLADRVVEIAWELPEVTPEDLYQQLERALQRPGPRSRPGRAESGSPPWEGAGAEPAGPGPTVEPDAPGAAIEGVVAGAGPPRPAAGTGLPSRVQDLARSLRGLLGQLGGSLAALGERLQWEWIDHSTLVQKLLHEFREGDPTRAIQHSFSIVPADPRQPTVPWGHRLPWSRAIYSLLDLLGRPGRGQGVAVWTARPDLLQELTQEYRKAAELAMRQGDCRRAAYIHGKLLGDDRTAARVLQRGGLRRDAATLYLKKLNDPAAAAQAFEAAGELDRAIALYRQVGGYESAGDLLRRIGDETGATAEYHRAAAARAASTPPDHYRAGLLLLHKARSTDPAIAAFQAGWDRRPDPNATSCALELVRIHAERGAIAPIRILLDEADASLTRLEGPPDEAGSFFNTTALLIADAPALRPFAAEIHDRALLALSRRLRQNLAGGQSPSVLVSALFDEAVLWPAALRSDAEFAVAAAARRSRTGPPPTGPEPHDLAGIQLREGTVTAVCQAAATGDLFLGFDTGRVLAFRPRRNQVLAVADQPGMVRALAVDPDGQVVVALRKYLHGCMITCSLKALDGTFRSRPDSHLPGLSGGFLTPVLPWGVDWLVGLGIGHDLAIVEALSGLPWRQLHLMGETEAPPTTAVVLPIGPASGQPEPRLAVLTHDGPRWVLLDGDGRRLRGWGPTWCPAAPGSFPLRCVPLAWRRTGAIVELVGLDDDGAVHATEFDLESGSGDRPESRTATVADGYLAATSSGTGTIVAVSRTRIDWLGARPGRFQPVHTLNLSLPRTVACFPSFTTREILTVGSDGFIARIAPPLPGSMTRSPGRGGHPSHHSIAARFPS